MHAKEVELFRNVSVLEFYRLKALITLEQINTSVKNLDGDANFGTSEYFSGRKKEECLRANFSETSIVRLSGRVL